jgi:prepilin-type N-terminal cleavage/methylation domain-containing protein
MKKMNWKKGFTLIELLVVVAIIGILASVVLASLNTARAKGADAAVKADLANARAQAALFYDSNNNTYAATAVGNATDVCSPTGLASGVTGISQLVSAAALAGGNTLGVENALETGTTAVCDVGLAFPSQTWVAQAPLKSVAGTYWCVDSSGTSKQEPAPLAASSLACI